MEGKVQATGIIDSVEALEARMAEMRKAQAVFATYSQEQVDKIFAGTGRQDLQGCRYSS